MFLFVAALAFGLILSAYLFTHELVTTTLAHFAKADQCDDATQGEAVNPNKMLFISCGGFID